MVICRGEVWWAKLPDPTGSEPGYHRPVVIISADTFNISRIQTIVGLILTTNVRLADVPGNVLISRKESGLPKASVVNVSQVVTADKSVLTKKYRQLSSRKMAQIDAGVRLVLSL